MLKEYGVRLAFKAIPTNSTDSFGNKVLNVTTEGVLEVSKKIVRGEVAGAVKGSQERLTN